MERKHIEEAKTKLIEINQLITQLDPSIRSAAFDILAPHYFSDIPSMPSHKNTGKVKDLNSSEAPDFSDLGAFISSFDTSKPTDNVMLLVAWLYASYGLYPMTAKEIKELGDSCGLITPSRPDNTMRQAKRSGKGLFTQQGKGWQPTVSGELFLKNTYQVKKGNKPIPKE